MPAALARLGFDAATIVKLGQDQRAETVMARLMAEQFDGQVFALVVLNSRDREARAQDMNALRQFTRQTLQAGSGETSRR